MNIEDIFIPAPKVHAEPWQLGGVVKEELQNDAVALIFCSEERGANRDWENHSFDEVRTQLYRLSAQDWEISLVDLGDFISGKTLEDTHYALEETMVYCMNRNVLPVVIGGSNAIAYSLFRAAGAVNPQVRYTQINSFLTLKNEDRGLSDENFLARIFKSTETILKQYNHLGFQKHANDFQVMRLMNEVDFEVVRLAEMIGNVEKNEPYFRNADLVTVNCDAVESFSAPFSFNPQVNGLNRREICAYMKEAGLSQNLKLAGIFNYDFSTADQLNDQLLAEMIWYLLEGINIRRTHPEHGDYETFYVMVGDHEVTFKRDTFSNLWYFGNDPDAVNCLPCAASDYEDAKKGFLKERLLKFES